MYDYELMEAIWNKNVKLVRELIERGANVNRGQQAYGKLRDTPLCYAAEWSSVEVVRELIKAGANVNAYSHATTPLHYAAKRKSLELVSELIKAGADVNALNTISGGTPLHGAAFTSNIEVIRELINSGADVNARSRHGDTPLSNAVSRENVEFIRELINSGAIVGNEELSATHNQKIITLIKTFLYDIYKRSLSGDRIEQFLPDGTENTEYRNIPSLPPDIVDKIARFASGVPQVGGFGKSIRSVKGSRSVHDDIKYLLRL